MMSFLALTCHGEKPSIDTYVENGDMLQLSIEQSTVFGVKKSFRLRTGSITPEFPVKITTLCFADKSPALISVLHYDIWETLLFLEADLPAAFWQTIQNFSSYPLTTLSGYKILNSGPPSI